MASLTSLPGESNAAIGMDDPESIKATVAHFIEQLHANMSSPHEKELIMARLLGIARSRKEARILIGSHSQAMPLFISILRGGIKGAKVNVALTLATLCKEEELQVRILLGGCIPPLLSLLKSEALEARRAAAEAIFELSSGGLSDDHVGMKIFVTEGVVPTLWDQLNPKTKQDKVVEEFVTGALRNLCGDKEGYWKAALEAGGVEIIVDLLSSDNAAAQSNAASLLALLVSAFDDSINKVLGAGAVEVLLRLMGQENDISVRASAADALESLSSKSSKAQKAVVDAGGIPVLIESVVAPSKECMQGELAWDLQGHAVHALANIYGGMSSLILYLGALSQSPRLLAPVADIIGALAYSLMVFKQPSGIDEPFDAKPIEDILLLLLKPRDNKLVQERILEALGSLYGNTYLSTWLDYAKTKRVLVGLITMASGDVQEYLIHSLISLCCDGLDIWEALGKKEGVQLLISFLGLSGKQHQEYAVALLAILTDEVDDSKWAITAAGGIPPLVQLLEIGSLRAREDAAQILWNLCCHSEDIRACVESSGAVPALLWLLINGGPKAREASSKALRRLIHSADPATVSQLLDLLLGDSPTSKAHVITVLGHVLAKASHKDLVQKGAPANKGLRSLVQVLNSSNEETQEHAASVLADIFSTRQDICDSLETDEIVHPCMQLLASKTQVVVTQTAPALGMVSQPTNAEVLSNKTPSPGTVSQPTNALGANKTPIPEGDVKPHIKPGDVRPLIKLAKSSSMDAAETAVAALANLLSNPEIVGEALAEDVISALTRVLGEGSVEGKKNVARVLHQLLKYFPVSDVLTENTKWCIVVHKLVDSLAQMNLEEADSSDALEILALLARTKHNGYPRYAPCSALAEVPLSLEPLVCYLADGHPADQDKAIEILSRLCGDQPGVLGDMLVGKPRCVRALADRVVNSSSLEVRVGGAALLICAAREHKQCSMDVLDGSGFLKQLIYSLVDMMKHHSYLGMLEIERRHTFRGYVEQNSHIHERDEFEFLDPATALGRTVALWLLVTISSFHKKSKLTIVEAGGVEVLSNKLASFATLAELECTEGIWISALLLAILFQDATVALSPETMLIIPSLVFLLRSDGIINRYFAAQAIASLVCSGSKEIHLAIANSGAIGGLITLLGNTESDMQSLVALSKEFSLLCNPDQVVLEHLFQIEDVRVGAMARKSIPLLVDLLRPMPDKPGAPPIAVCLLIQIAEGSDVNKLAMAEAGAVDALTKYLSLSPQDLTETNISSLLRILFSNPDLLHYEASLSALHQLIAVLQLGSRSARFSAAGALQVLFDAENIRDAEMARQTIRPLVNMLNMGSEREQHAALVALIKLTSTSTSKTLGLTDAEVNPLESLHKILSSASSLELKRNAAQLCYVLFGISDIRALPLASECMQPLILLMKSDTSAVVESAVHAFERLLDDNQHAELAASSGVVSLLIGLVSSLNCRLAEVSINALIKMGKDRPHCKLDMVRAGIVDNALEMLPVVSSSLCSSIAELLRILTNNSGIAKSVDAERMVEPLFLVLQRPNLSMLGQHSTLQALVNILEKPESLKTLRLNPSQVIDPLTSFLKSPSQAIQQLGTELLLHILAQKHFQQDVTTKNAAAPLVQLAGIGRMNLQQTAIKALENISTSWPQSVADAGGIFKLSQVLMQDDLQPSYALWKSSALILSNILCFDSMYYFKVSPLVLVRMLHSTLESTVAIALSALIMQQRSDPSIAVVVAEAGAIDSLLELLRSHQCEEASGRLLEALFNNAKVREMKACKYAIAPLSQYLLDPQTRSEPARLLAALALGDLFQKEAFARAHDSVSACHALVSILEDQPAEEMKMVAVCALQNLVMNSRTNRHAVAEAGGILVIQELLLSIDSEVAGQAALLIKFLFSNHTLQEYVSNELVISLTAALERELWARAAITEVLQAINMIFGNFSKLHSSEAATLCLQHLVDALKAGNESAQESALDTLCLLKQSWSIMPIDVAKAQATAAAEAIPILQLLMKNCPPRFHDRANSLLNCLPGCLTVTIKRGSNLKQSMGSTNAFCRLTIGTGPPRQTKVVHHSTSPEWKEGFTWAFNMPPKGQKLHILCKSKNTFGKTTLGRLTIQIDKVLTEGLYSGSFNLNHDNSKDGSSRTLEIEILWSNGMSD